MGGKNDSPATTGKESKGHKNIYAALSAFQGELKPIDQSAEVNFKTKSGDTVNFTYAPLEKIMETLYPLLAKHGLSVRHELTDGIECILTHETTTSRDMKSNLIKAKPGADGDNAGAFTKDREIETYGVVFENEIRSGKLPIKTGGDMKETGAQITYARRYTLGLVLGLSTEQDKDVEFLEKSKENVEKYALRQARETIEKTSGKELLERVEFLKGELKKVKEKKVPSLGLKQEQYEELIALGEKKIEKEITGGRGGDGGGGGGGGAAG